MSAPVLRRFTGDTSDDRPVRPRIAVALAVGLMLVTAFQTASTFGAPFGAAAQGGTNPGALPDALRLRTGAGAVVWLIAALVVLARGGRALVSLPQAVTRVGTWAVAALLAVGAVLNFASSSPWERFGWGPYTLVMLTLCLVLARSGTPANAAQAAGGAGQ
jgi:hypothetical protein